MPNLSTFSLGGVILLVTAFQQSAIGQSHPEVLVVYNSAYSDSLAVANHYMTARNIPSGNLCAIAPPANDFLSLSDYTTYVKTPVQNCLNTVGKTNILYIVMSYLTPFSISPNAPLGGSAVDSYLGDVWDKYISTQPIVIAPNVTQPYYADSQSQGNVYSPFQSFAAYRANARNPLIYSVWRLDAPTAAIASALVDQALTAEANFGPSGQACLDHYFGNPITNNLPDAGYYSGDWDLSQAASFLRQAGLTVTENSTDIEFYSSPTAPTCPNTAFYTGWYSYDHYNSGFIWETGSVGWHLDSASALNPRSGPSWVPNALSAGIAVTSGSVAEPYLQGFVRAGGAYRNLLEGASVGDAFLRNTRWLKWQIINVGDPLYKPFTNHSGPAGRPPFSPLQPVNSFQIGPQEIVGGTNTTGTITLSAAAPSGGTTFTLSAPAGITVPVIATVTGGATKASFPITTALVTESQYNVISATAGALTLQNTIITDPLIGALLPSFSTTMAGIPVSVTVLLNGRAPVGGATVSLSSDNPAITVPASVTVPVGGSSATFTAGSIHVSSTVTANVIGTYAGAGTSAAINVVPAISAIGPSPNPVTAGSPTVISITLGTNVPPGYTATVQVMSSDPASLPVPSSITIPAGTNYGAFLATSSAGASGNTPTITATYGGATATTMVTID